MAASKPCTPGADLGMVVAVQEETWEASLPHVVSSTPSESQGSARGAGHMRWMCHGGLRAGAEAAG